MALPRSTVAVLLVMLLVCKYCSAQGGCKPSPPTGLTVPSAGSFGELNKLRTQFGCFGINEWSVFTASQVQTSGLWCQVRAENNAGMGSNIGDWYYPTAENGFTLLSNVTDDGTPYLSLKCTNQIGLVVDADMTNNQGIVKCSTTVPNLDAKARFFGVYLNFDNYAGPVVDSVMTVSVLSARDDSNVDFTLSFNVSDGPPSHVRCSYGNDMLLIGCRNPAPGCDREVIRSHYVSSSQPDMTRVIVKVMNITREPRTYTCTVTVEGRMPIGNRLMIVPYGTPRTTTVSITVAGIPTVVTANRNGLTSVLVSWTAPSPAAGYEVFFQAAGGSRFSGGNASNTQLNVSGLTLGRSYTIFVVAFGAEGDPVFPSAPSMSATVPTLDIPQLTTNPMLSSPSTTSIMVSWTRPQVQFKPDSYTVSYSCQLLCGSAPTTRSVTITDGGATSHALSSLIPGSRCDVSVTAVFGSSSSNTVTSSANTTSAAPTGTPGGLTSTSVESRSLAVVWGTVPCPQQRGPITGYTLRYNNGTFIANIMGVNNRQHQLTGLTPFTRYSVQVAAVNDGGTGPFSEPAFPVETLQEAPGPVSGLSASREVVQLTISWMPPSMPNGVITNYEVVSNSSGGFIYNNTLATQLTLRNLLPNTIVTFSVRAYTIIGPGDNVSDHASTGGVPVVTNLAVTVLDSTTVNVSWTPVNLPVSVVDRHTVNYSTVDGGSGRRRQSNAQISFPGTASSGVVPGLMTGQQYQFGVSVTLVAANGQMYTGPVVNSDPVTLEAASGANIGAIVGAVIGVLALLVVVGVVLFLLLRHSGRFSSLTVSERKSQPVATNYAVYDQPEPPTESKEVKMTECIAYGTQEIKTTECIAYDTYQQQSSDGLEYESIEYL